MRTIPVWDSVHQLDRCYRFDEELGQVGPATIRAGKFLAALCLTLGIAFTALVPASPEQRIASLLIFGLLPAAGLWAAGHVVGHLLTLGSKLIEIVALRCLRYAAVLMKRFMSWITQPAAVSVLGEKLACYWFGISGQNRMPRRPLAAASVGVLCAVFGLAWWAASAIWPVQPAQQETSQELTMEALVERILSVESDGDPDKKNKRSSATGAGQFIRKPGSS